VLAVANSAVYGGMRVRSLPQALARLGTGTIRDILYQAVSECPVFRGRAGRALTAERTHAVTVSHVMRSLCKKVGAEEEYAFVCGLLHDIGRAVLLELFHHEPPAEIDRAEIPGVITLIHTTVGRQVARNWQLPGLVIESAKRHHQYRDFDGAGSYSQIGNLVAAADDLAIHVGAGRPT
jgi:putative nucleotidyltransferase with HDIG domain